MFLSGAMSLNATFSLTLWMLALGGPNSMTWGQIWAMKRPSLVPPVVESSVVRPVSSLMACHHLTYLSVCERAGIRVLEYRDHGTGTLAMKDGKMRMVEVSLAPQVRIADASQVEQARELHAKAHSHCFMSNSVNFEVKVEPAVTA